MFFKALDAYFFKSVEKGQVYELYNHLLHYFGRVLQQAGITALPAEMFPHTRNEFEIDPS